MTQQKPMLRAYTIVKREGQDDYWLPIGAAFPHQSGDGFNLILQALPIAAGDGQCKIVLRPPKGDEEEQRPQGSNAQRIERGERDKSGYRRR